MKVNKPKNVLLAGVSLLGKNIKNSLDELASLVYTVGAEVVATVTQNRETVDNEFYIGRGKVDEMAELIDELDIDLIVFNNALSGRQIKNLNEALSVSIIDRNMLILDIFAMRASSIEGKLQVELAQLNYSLPRLLGQGKVLDRQGAGIGTRGPGETKLEVDRRMVRDKIADKKKQIDKLALQRETRRKQRLKSEKSVAIVGYTNAGKSTLMNVLTKAGVLAEDKLFATLDPITRKIWMDASEYRTENDGSNWQGGFSYTLTDTVGFIQDLPHEFIDAFKSTLEEAKYADLLLHVVDISSIKLVDEFKVVETVLGELEAHNKPAILVLNKVDILYENGKPNNKAINNQIEQIENIQNYKYITLSATHSINIEELKKLIVEKLFG